MKDFAEVRFAWLLRQRGIRYCDERNFPRQLRTRRTQPDFYAIPSRFRPFLAEVESFREPGPLRKATARVYAASPDQMLRRLRNIVQRAAKQLKPYRDVGVPMIVVLDGWRRVGVALGQMELMNLLGTQEIRYPMDPATGLQMGPTTVRGSEKSFRLLTPTTCRYLSGVAVNLSKRGYHYATPWNKTRPMRVRILHNPYANIPLPQELLSDPEDEHIGQVDGQWVDLKSGLSLFGDKRQA